uniref:Ovule protein n=1 Tax=Steinernema glaseri TaxID=37863 RepID=A0A1I7YYG3_9BILA
MYAVNVRCCKIFAVLNCGGCKVHQMVGKCGMYCESIAESVSFGMDRSFVGKTCDTSLIKDDDLSPSFLM